jgi:hypothetical protein
MGGTRNEYTILFGKLEGNLPHGGGSVLLKPLIKLWGVRVQTEFFWLQDGDQWQCVVDAVMCILLSRH